MNTHSFFSASGGVCQVKRRASFTPPALSLGAAARRATEAAMTDFPNGILAQSGPNRYVNEKRPEL
jgi:hypothetical protein